DAHQIGPRLAREHHVACCARRDLALGGTVGAELDPADRRPCRLAGRDIERSGAGATRREAADEGDRARKYSFVLPLHFVAPVLSRGYKSHKAFVSPLNRLSLFEANTHQKQIKYLLHLNQIRIKFYRAQFE